MPHEVIMPALGMAQDSGQIVAWLKQPGDAVRAGEALMEVETDKATMKVEAAADGYLTDVRAKEGDSIPVGKVVAVISDTADGTGDTDTAADKPKAEATPAAAAEPDNGSPVTGQEVIMPALGMAQDSGRIVAWEKAPGDKVSAEDVLLEVETDKATMEVQAGHSGWLAEIRGAEGEDIPVGNVIAIISAEKPADLRRVSHSKATGEATTASSAGERRTEPRAAAQQSPEPQKAPRQQLPSRAAPAGRILASPKARRLASERGLDLRRLVEAGHEPPFHTTDLETLAAMGAPAPDTAPTTPAGPIAAHLEAEVPLEGLEAFCEWSRGEGTPVPRERVILAFAAAALRGADRNGPLHVEIVSPGRASQTFADPDCTSLGTAAERVDTAPDLIIRDLTQSRLTGALLGVGAAPVLTVGRRGQDLALTLDFDTGELDPTAAITLLDAVAARISEPLRHLL